MSKLYQYKRHSEPRFCPVKEGIIQNDKAWGSRPIIAKGDVVMLVDRLAYTEKTAAAAYADDAAALAEAAAAATSASAAAAHADWNKVWDLWGIKQIISGAIYLHPNGKTIWISDIDIKYFGEIKSAR